MRLVKTVFSVAAVVVLVLLQTPSFAAPGSAAGRKHAAKASHLAAQNRCKAAVVEFTKAYKLLKDPALLFNRAECYRKIGKSSRAVSDYEQFLTEMPTAPNRSTIEARIASLRGGTQAPRTGVARTTAKPDEPHATAGDSHAEKWGRSAGGPNDDEGKSTGSSQGAGSAALGTAAHPATELTTQPQIAEPKRVGRSHAWIWIGTAVVVVGAGAFAAYHYWPRPKTDVPQTPLGNYAF
jgi:tetratricopeptide (TPR) repeat protein